MTRRTLRFRRCLASTPRAIAPLILSLFAASSLSGADVGEVQFGDTSVRIELADATKLADGVVRLPRLCNPIGNVYLQGDAAKTPLKFTPLVKEWLVTLPAEARSGQQTVIVETVGKPRRAGEPTVIVPAKNGVIDLFAHEAVTHGDTLRYEPQPHKNTVGYWSNKNDWCQWRFRSERAGRYEVWLWQGCGKGQGGSEVALRVAGQELTFTVEETGHFQNFKGRPIGTMTIENPGEHTLELRPISKAAAAVMDVRHVRLIPVPEP